MSFEIGTYVRRISKPRTKFRVIGTPWLMKCKINMPYVNGGGAWSIDTEGHTVIDIRKGVFHAIPIADLESWVDKPSLFKRIGLFFKGYYFSILSVLDAGAQKLLSFCPIKKIKCG